MTSIMICCIRFLGLVWPLIKCPQVLKSCIVINLGPSQIVFVQICADVESQQMKHFVTASDYKRLAKTCVIAFHVNNL